MQTRYLETGHGSSAKSSFNEGVCAGSIKEDSFDCKKYKPISKAAGSRARLNSPEASLNSLFGDSLLRRRASPGPEAAASLQLRRAPTEAAIRRREPGDQPEAGSGPRLRSPPDSQRLVQGRQASPLATGRPATDSCASLHYRPILLSPKPDALPVPGRKQADAASSHRGFSDSDHTEAAVLEQLLQAGPDRPPAQREPAPEASLLLENSALRRQVRELQTDLAQVLRVNELLLHKLSTLSARLPGQQATSETRQSLRT